MGFVILLIALVAVSSRSGANLVNGCFGLVFGGLLLLVAGAIIAS